MNLFELPEGITKQDIQNHIDKQLSMERENNLKLIKKEVEELGGSFVTDGFETLYLVEACATHEDYYYVCLDNTADLRFLSCVGNIKKTENTEKLNSLKIVLQNNPHQQIAKSIKTRIQNSKTDVLFTPIFIERKPYNMDILVIIDVQNDFVSGSLGTPEAEAIVPKVADKIRNWKGDIYCTYDTHDEYYLESFEGIKLPVKHCIKGEDGWEYPEEIMNAFVDFKNKHIVSLDKFTNFNPYLSEIVEKDTFGSFKLLDRVLKSYNHGINSITVIGLVTDICVVTNALLLKTKFPDVEIIVDSSCCAGTTPEMHQKALDVMRSCQINII